MYLGLKHTHLLIISLFLINFLIKTILLLSNEEKFTAFRNKTKLVEIILGTLVLVSGFSLFFYRGVYNEMWLNVKMLLVFAAIPIGIVGMKKGNKALALLSLSIFLYIFAVAWTKSLSFSTPAPAVETSFNEHNNQGMIKTVECASFHGNKLPQQQLLQTERTVRSTEQSLAIN